jgi:hypothetical protein
VGRAPQPGLEAVRGNGVNRCLLFPQNGVLALGGMDKPQDACRTLATDGDRPKGVGA